MAIVTDEIEYIDPNTKKVVYTSGREAPLSEEASFALFASPGQKQIREGVKKSEMDWYERDPLPKSVTAFTKGFADSNIFAKLATDYILDPLAAGAGAIQTREGQENLGYIGRLGENYIAQRMGRRDAAQEIESMHPTAKNVASIAALGADLAMPLPAAISKSPIRTGAVFGAGASPRSAIEDPGQFATSTAIGAGIGYGLGKIGSRIEGVATERRALREFQKGEIEAQRSYQEAFHDYQKLQKEADSAYERAMSNFGRTEAEAQRAYQENLQEYQRLTAEAELAYKESVDAFKARMGQKIQAMEKDLGNYGINKQAIDLEKFINSNIGVSSKAGTKEAKEVSNFLRSVYDALPETLAAQDVARLYEAVETKMLQGGEFQAPVMQAFKEHLIETLPVGAAQNKLMGKIFPRVEKQVERLVDKLINRLPQSVVREVEKEFGKGAVQAWKQQLAKDLRNRFQGMSTNEFIEVLSAKDSSPFVEALTQNELYQAVIDLPAYKASNAMPGMPPNVRILAQQQMPATVFEAQSRFQQLAGDFRQGIAELMSNQSIDARILVDETEKRITSRLSNATGIPNPNTGRMATNAPVAPYVASEAPIQPQPGSPPAKPARLEAPEAPLPGIPPEVGRLAQRFETEPLKATEKGAFAAGTLGLGKLLGIPGVGKVAAGMQGGKLAIEGALRGITDPGVVASATRRMAGDQGLRFTVEIIASYPSYSNGVLSDPQERKQAVAEIESDGSIPLEDKAILQAYINRGKNLESLIGG